MAKVVSVSLPRGTDYGFGNDLYGDFLEGCGGDLTDAEREGADEFARWKSRVRAERNRRTTIGRGRRLL